MSEEDEKVERLRREVKSLKEQLSKIAEELEPEPEKETEDQTGVVEAGAEQSAQLIVSIQVCPVL